MMRVRTTQGAMAIIHFRQREIEARIVYWGPALSGKTTSLQALHDYTPRGRRGDLETLDTQEERTLYFDYLPLMWGTIAGFRGRVKILGVPGQALYRATRRLLLQGADGVVFVADSHPDQLSANVQSLNELQRALASLGRGLDEMPLVMQYNKRDLPDALSPKVLELALNARGAPAVETVATQGQGIADAFQAALEAVSTRVEAELAGGSDGDLVRGAISPTLPDGEEVRQTLHSIAQLRSDDGPEAASTRLEDLEPIPFMPQPDLPEVPDPAEESPPGLEDDADSDTAIPEGAELAQVPVDPPPPAARAVPHEDTQPALRGAPVLPPVHDPAIPAYAVVTLPYLPPQLDGYEVHSVSDPILEVDGTVMVRISVCDPDNGRLRRVRVRLVTDPAPPRVAAPEPLSAPSSSHTVPTLFTLAIGFGLGVGVVWLFLS